MRQFVIDPSRRYSVAEYFKLDEASEIRLEYVDGRIFEVGERPCGGDLVDAEAHSHIVHNVNGALWTRLRGSKSQGRGSDLRVRYGRRAEFGYADALIFGVPAQLEPKSEEVTLLNPRVLIEVLSDATESFDRGVKFERYREIESFEEYVLVAQDRPSVEVYRRQASGLWRIQPPYQGLDAVARIECVALDLPLAEVYAGIEFPPEPPLPDAPQA